jgi:glutaredoxin 3
VNASADRQPYSPKQEIETLKVVVYTTPTCPYCGMVKEFLSQKGVAFKEIDVSRDYAAAQELVSKTGQRGVPVVLLDGQVVVGFDRPRLEQILASLERPRLGVSVTNAGKMIATLGSGIAAGAYIGKISPESIASRMGLAPGDIILEINSQHITSVDDLERAVSRLVRGGSLSVVYLRNGREQTATGRI